MEAQHIKPVIGTPEALLQEASGKPLKATVFDYQRPEVLEKAKTVVWLCRTDIVFSAVQVVKEGGETNLHAHTANDGIWMVLKGRAKFYGIDDAVLAELGPLQGIQIPRGFFYWFESASSEPLELLQIEAIDKSVERKRIDMTPKREGFRAHVNPALHIPRPDTVK